MSVISDAIEASFRQECDQEACHKIAETIANAMHSENEGGSPTVSDGTVGLAIYCAHYIEAVCAEGESAPDKELHFFEALGGLIKSFLMRPGGAVEKRNAKHDTKDSGND